MNLKYKFYSSLMGLVLVLLAVFDVMASFTVYQTDLNVPGQTTITISENTQYTGKLSVGGSGTLIITSGDTLIIGSASAPKSADFGGIGSIVTIQKGAVLIIYGNLSTNSAKTTIDGELIVYGNIMANAQTNVSGSGVVTSTGSITNSGGSIFGDPTGCSIGPCFKSQASCSFSNSITYNGSNPVCSSASQITGSTNATSPTYLWEQFNNSTFGWVRASDINTEAHYTPTTLVVSTSFRRKVTSGSCTNASTPITINVVSAGLIGSDQSICSGTAPVTFTNIVSATSGAAFKWQISPDNINWSDAPAPNTASTYTAGSLTATAYYRRKVTWTSPSCIQYSNVVKVTVNNNPVSVSISANTGNTICSGTSVTFTATPTNGGASPAYQWKKNGTNISGATSATYITTGLANNDNITVVLTSNISCSSGNPATSNQITMSVNGNPVSVSVSANPGNTICQGTVVTFTATPTNGGSTPSYQWKKNGTTISGSTSSTYINNSLVNGDKISVVLTSNGCATGNPASSSPIAMTVNNSNPVSVSVTANPGNTICAGSPVTFTASAVNGGASPAYQWKKNGSNINGATSLSFSTSSLSNNDQITVEMTSNSNANCLTGNPATSSPYIMMVNDSQPISVSVTSDAGTTICEGKPVTFTANVVNGGISPAYQWKKNGSNVGTNSSTYVDSTLSHSDQVKVEVNSNIACASGNPAPSSPLAISVNPNSWTGSNDSNWDNKNNWCGSIPKSTMNITINSSGHNPIINSIAATNNLTLNQGSTLTISSGKSLAINGDLVNNGSIVANSNSNVIFSGTSPQNISGSNNFSNVEINNPTGVSISAGSSNKQKVNGILSLQKGTLIGNDNLIIDFTNGGGVAGTGSGSITGNVTYTRDINIPDWHYISSPAGTGSVADYADNQPFLLGYYYYYDQSFIANDMQQGWRNILSTSFSLDKMRGIAVRTTTPKSFDITKPYNHSATYSTPNLDFKQNMSDTLVGWHLIGNPYPSTIDWDSPDWTKTNINNAIYYYNPQNQSNGSYIAGVGINGATHHIAPMQAFWVQAKPGGGSISVNNKVRSNSSSSFFRVAANMPKARFKVASGNYSDETVVRFDTRATEFFDGDLDAYKFKNSGKCPSLYTSLGNISYAINSLKPDFENLTLPLRLEVGIKGNYTLSMLEFEDLDPFVSVYLQDKLTGQYRDLRMDPVYSFSANTSDNSDRFVLTFNAPKITGTVAESNPLNVRFTGYAGGIIAEFVNVKSGTAEVNVIDVMGRMVSSIKNAPISSGNYFIPMTSGSYIIKVNADDQLFTQKVIITE